MLPSDSSFASGVSGAASSSVDSSMLDRTMSCGYNSPQSMLRELPQNTCWARNLVNDFPAQCRCENIWLWCQQSNNTFDTHVCIWTAHSIWCVSM